ncbi:MAG: alkaline phosphatase [Prevotellaceae bacterium]|nr:alkaline phosphatase [Prevotellaceae bacterium]
MKKIFLSLLLFSSCMMAMAQYPILLHSHNDYAQQAPFWLAYAEKVRTVECDMFYVGGTKFLVGHDKEDMSNNQDFDVYYLEPIVRMYHANNGHAWNDDENRDLQLMIDIKSDDPDAFTKALVKKLKKYPDVFDRSVNPHACQVILTGNRPEPKDFDKYPAIIAFDGELKNEYTAAQLERVALISENFRDYCQWNGKGTLIYDEEVKVKAAIEKAHKMGKQIRFWGGPDTVTSWYTFINFGIDYINTDHPDKCAEFLKDWANQNYTILGESGPVKKGVTGTDRLDKITRGFAGFQNEKLQMKELIETYTPTYLNDGATDKPIKNVILLIGDGMGIMQMIAADRVNFGLSMMNMRYMGMVNNSTRDAYTTDSAASGSALATGKKHFNRHIAAEWDGTPNPSLTDYFYDQGKACGVLSLGDIADATPAAFYGHCAERDSSDIITRGLLDDKVTVVAGSGIKDFTRRNDGIDLPAELEAIGYDFVRNVSDIDNTAKKVICIDEEMDKACDVDNIGLLADATRRSIEKLTKASDKGFFMMVEGAKIDYAGHSRCLPGSIMETFSFDLAVKEALEFADTNGETLVIVTADHECGALVLVDGDNNTGRVTGYYLSNDHSPVYPLVLSYGPGASNFIGRYNQYDIANRIKELCTSDNK